MHVNAAENSRTAASNTAARTEEQSARRLFTITTTHDCRQPENVSYHTVPDRLKPPTEVRAVSCHRVRCLCRYSSRGVGVRVVPRRRRAVAPDMYLRAAERRTS